MDLRPLYRKLMNSVNKQIKVTIRESYNARWNKTLQNVKTGDKKLWTLTKKMMNKGSNKIEMLKVNDKPVTGNVQIAEVLADQFYENHSLTVNFKHSIDTKVKNVVDSISRIVPESIQCESHHVNASDVKKMITKLKVKKSPGLDGIANILLKRLT